MRGGRSAVAMVLGGLLLAACQTDPGEVAGDAGTDGQPAGADVEVDEEEVALEELHVTFTGEADEAGCRYEGPATVEAGPVLFTVENEADEEVFVLAWQFAEGYGYEDHLEIYGGEYPLDEQAAEAPTYEWLEGDWRPLAHADPGETTSQEVAFTPGEHGALCWIPGDPEIGRMWPATALTVTD